MFSALKLQPKRTRSSGEFPFGALTQKQSPRDFILREIDPKTTIYEQRPFAKVTPPRHQTTARSAVVM